MKYYSKYLWYYICPAYIILIMKWYWYECLRSLTFCFRISFFSSKTDWRVLKVKLLGCAWYPLSNYSGFFFISKLIKILSFAQCCSLSSCWCTSLVSIVFMIHFVETVLLFRLPIIGDSSPQSYPWEEQVKSCAVWYCKSGSKVRRKLCDKLK